MTTNQLKLLFKEKKAHIDIFLKEKNIFDEFDHRPI